MPTRPFYLFLTLLAFSTLLRWGSFSRNVINHDESTYIVIADEMLRGEIYLGESIDTKPIGIFWLYVAMVYVTGGSIIGLRFLATLFIALTAFFLFKSGKRATGSDRVGWAAALAYPLVMSVFTYYGISPNTELFFNCFTAAAIMLTIPRLIEHWHAAEQVNINPVRYALAGLLLGCAFIIKPVTGAESLVIGLFLLYWGWSKGRLVDAIFKACLPLTLAFTLPVFLVVGYYAQLGMLEELYFYNWEVTRRYPADKAWYLRLKFMGDYFLRYSPLVLLAIAAWMERKKDRPWQQFLLLQLALVSLMVVIPGKTFGHYQVQLNPALCALAACWWLPERTNQPWLRKFSLRKGIKLLALLALLLGVTQFFYYHYKHDRAGLAAAWLKEHLNPEEDFIMLKNNHIVYHLLGRPVPSPYVHGTLLFYHHHIENMDIDLEAEARRIEEQHNLRYVVAYINDLQEEKDHPIIQTILRLYEPREQLDDELVILERRSQ